MSGVYGQNRSAVSSCRSRAWSFLALGLLLLAAALDLSNPARAQGVVRVAQATDPGAQAQQGGQGQQAQSSAPLGNNGVTGKNVMMIDSGPHAIVKLAGNAWAEVEKSTGNVVQYFQTVSRNDTDVVITNPDTNLKLRIDLPDAAIYASTDGSRPTQKAASIVETSASIRIAGLNIAWDTMTPAGQGQQAQSAPNNNQGTQQAQSGANTNQDAQQAQSSSSPPNNSGAKYLPPSGIYAALSGLNVRMVDTGAHALVELAGQAWAEVDKSTGNVVQYFQSVSRNNADVVILNPDANLTLRINVPDEAVYASTDGSRPTQKVASIADAAKTSQIAGSNVAWDRLRAPAQGQQAQSGTNANQGTQQAQSPPPAQSGGVTGKNVMMIDSGPHAIVKLAGNAWAEVDKSTGDVVQYYQTVSRNDTDVVITNSDTNLRLRIDLPDAAIYASTDGSRPTQKAASIVATSETSRIAGLNVAWDKVTPGGQGQQAQGGANNSSPPRSGQASGGGTAAGQTPSANAPKVMIQNHAKAEYLGVQGSTIVAGRRSNDGSSTWIVLTTTTDKGASFAQLKSAKTGEYLTFDNGALVLSERPATKAAGLWKLVETSDGSVTIHSALKPREVITSDNGQVVVSPEKGGALADEWTLSGDPVAVTVKPLDSDPVTAGMPSVKFSNKTGVKLEVVAGPNDPDHGHVKGELEPNRYKVFKFLPRTEIGFYDPKNNTYSAGSNTYKMAAGPEMSIEIFADRLEDSTPSAAPAKAATANNTISITIDNKSGVEVLVQNMGASAAGPEACKLADQQQTLKTVAVNETYHQPVVPGTCLMFANKKTGGWVDDPNPTIVVAGPNFLSVEVDKNSVHAPETLYSKTDIQNFANAVLQNYIQLKTSMSTATFCWRNSNGRGVGTIPGRVADCPTGYTNNGLTCGKGADTIPAASQGYANCPSPYVNSGFHTCIRLPDSFWQCGGTCRDPYYHASVCTCQYWGDSLPASSMVCAAGYSPSIIGTCIKNCPSGYTNTGETCFRGADTLGLSSMTCHANEVRGGGRCFPKPGDCGSNADYDAGLCYPKCKNTQDGVGPVCWDKCPAKWKACGAGCAVDKDTCDQTIINQTTSPVLAAGNIALTVVTAGGSAAADAAAAAAKTAAEVGGETAAKAGAEVAAKATIEAGVKTALQKAAIALTTDAGRAALLKEVAFQTAINTAVTIGGYAGTKIYSTVSMQKQVQDDIVQKLAANTDPKVVNAITTQVMSGIEAQNPGADFPWASLDPSGIASVVEAFNYPLCSDVK